MILGPEEQPITAVPEKLPGPGEKHAAPGERLEPPYRPWSVQTQWSNYLSCPKQLPVIPKQIKSPQKSN